MNNDISLFARRTVVVASQNRGKLQELKELFHDLPIDLIALSVLSPTPMEIVEDGATFEANARKKAQAVANAFAMPTLADDSGLEVDLLGGRPGVRSARYAGDHATDAENNRKLLAELDALDPGGPRRARFRCVLVLVDPVHPDRKMEASGACEGAIAAAPRGQGGFGYDPIFLVEGVPGNRTMAELSEDQKNVVSHRAKAALAMREVFKAWLAL